MHQQQLSRLIRKLVKNFQPKKREEDEYSFTWSKSFLDMLKEVFDMASQHEVVAENLTGTVSKTLQDLVQELKTDRKKHLQEGVRLQEQLKQSSQALEKSLQEMDEGRILKIQESVFQCAEIEKNVIPIINTCIEGIAKAAGNISPSQDSKAVIERYKSGFPIPEDVQFEDLSSSSVDSSHSSPASHITTPSNTVKSGTVSGKSKKRGGIFGLFGSSKVDDQKEDFSDLPPTQRRRKLQQKIDSIKKEMAKETSEREGILKLKDVYANNQALGDPSTLDKKIEENSQKLETLRQELEKYEGYMADAEGKTTSGTSNSLPVRRNSASEDSHSLSTSGSGDTPHNPQVSAPGTNQLNVYQPIDGDEEAEDEFDIFPVIGRCRALYPFEAINEGSVPMGENEEMQILEQDQGDGWTRVRKNDGSEGFVPTSYIECHYYDVDQV
ncbi:formin-binding protein 1-like protein [Plakobranchus ocellatus]|uniref:Formin-binding protein 1-like protein n=1 Tax=Plakobranchus ocellatus TaxID=259542 RepID=A0AAV3ZE83_9GAST|nr:formin-binding protein 1-like protein [Plakobranchus ocellatus]